MAKTKKKKNDLSTTVKTCYDSMDVFIKVKFQLKYTIVCIMKLFTCACRLLQCLTK